MSIALQYSEQTCFIFSHLLVIKVYILAMTLVHDTLPKQYLSFSSFLGHSFTFPFGSHTFFLVEWLTWPWRDGQCKSAETIATWDSRCFLFKMRKLASLSDTFLRKTTPKSKHEIGNESHFWFYFFYVFMFWKSYLYSQVFRASWFMWIKGDWKLFIFLQEFFLLIFLI